MSIQIFGQDQLSGHNYWDITAKGEGKVLNYQAYDQIGIDAAGRNRVSQLTTLFDGKVVNGHTSLIFEVSGTGTQTLSGAHNSMEVGANEWVVFQTRRFYPYFSGKSQVIECTFDKFGPQTDIEKRFGYFSSNALSPYDSAYDGFYIESSSDTVSLHVENTGTDKLNIDITQWSGYANLGEYQDPANWNNFTVCIFDFLWLGGAVLRFWVKTQKGFVLAHQFNYSGTTQGTFTACPCQPLRYEMRSTGGTGEFDYICSQVATEGSFQEDGIVRSVNTTHTGITLATAGTVYPVISISKQADFRGVASRLQDFAIFVTSVNDQVLWTVQINPTLSAPLSYSNVPDSSIRYALGNGTITVTSPGSVMAAGYSTQNSILPTQLLENNFLSYMGGDLDDTMDEYVLCATPLAGNSNVVTFGSMAYKEY